MAAGAIEPVCPPHLMRERRADSGDGWKIRGLVAFLWYSKVPTDFSAMKHDDAAGDRHLSAHDKGHHLRWSTFYDFNQLPATQQRHTNIAIATTIGEAKAIYSKVNKANADVGVVSFPLQVQQDSLSGCLT